MWGIDSPLVKDALDIDSLSSLDIIVTCQGGSYTKQVHPELMKAGWKGYWIDSASTLRLNNDSIIVLDPVNRSVIDAGLSSGIKTYVGGNCTVSLMLMALSGLFSADLVEWISSMTYQAASGAGANNMKELIIQMGVIADAAKPLLEDQGATAIAIDEVVTAEMRKSTFPVDNFLAPLAGSLLPWIDSPLETGQTREEWKGFVETNKILQTETPIPIDGMCVRVGAMRCHSQALTVKLKKNLPMDKITDLLGNGNQWVRLVQNDKTSTIRELTPASVNGTLDVPIGRLRKLMMGPEYLGAFTVGDQLLWGAAEPVRRILKIIIQHLS